jgi:hypothetical protein
MMLAQINYGSLLLKVYKIVINLQSSDEDNRKSVINQLFLCL